MKVGTIIQHKRYPQNGTFKVIEVFDEFPKQGITEIIFHPVGEPDKLQAGWARHYEELTEYQTALLLASKAAIEAEGVTKESLEFLYNSCIVESCDALAIVADDLFAAIEQL